MCQRSWEQVWEGSGVQPRVSKDFVGLVFRLFRVSSMIGDDCVKTVGRLCVCDYIFYYKCKYMYIVKCAE